MNKLKKHLEKTLLENPANTIKNSVTWHLPLITYDVTFKREKRSKMDILMKMMLHTFEQAEIRRAANLSELLLVEELFIEDLLKKMQRMGLIKLEKQVYRLTLKGQKQLKDGIIAEEMDEESTTVSYSVTHDEFWPETSATIETTGDFPDFRYAKQEASEKMTEARLLDVLKEKEEVIEEDGFQTEVAVLTNFSEQKVEHIPCVEFQLYNKEQDIFFARVWNTELQRWDEQLEKEIEDKEMVEWREKWKAEELEEIAK
ncbi:hypothetical protein FS935_01700 [Metabacillus litoralis]|uniref:Uncharacterized protein n=1 Tax=Metabacillus litoralis TaxID=152268 RepID=A0A5C6W6A6_9BACI|nr:hypothetical protein [Metabacillus litoralis]TXC92934.1 hypothetical protein FS935_01700 [Metabacillus litoralis]